MAGPPRAPVPVRRGVARVAAPPFVPAGGSRPLGSTSCLDRSGPQLQVAPTSPAGRRHRRVSDLPGGCDWRGEPDNLRSYTLTSGAGGGVRQLGLDCVTLRMKEVGVALKMSLFVAAVESLQGASLVACYLTTHLKIGHWPGV